MAEKDARPFMGSNFQTTLKDLETRMRNAAANLEFEEAARLRDELKRLKLLDLEFANEVLTAEGETVDRSARSSCERKRRRRRRSDSGRGGGGDGLRLGSMSMPNQDRTEIPKHLRSSLCTQV